MCYRHMMIRTHLDSGQKVTFVPCGKCEECRDSMRMQWQFRLRTELDYCRKIGWHIGFFTLTYDDAHLHYLPKFAFKEEVPAEPIPCFSRYDVSTFIANIRKRVNELYGVSGLRYLVASELGSFTERPHYHGIICFPPQIKPEQMWDLIHNSWTIEKLVTVSRPDRRFKRKSRMIEKKRVVRVPLGFIFPRYITGGVDSHGYVHKPFLVDGDVEGAAQYVAKYVCKDLDFYKSLGSYELVDRKSDEWRFVKDCLPFHLQSQGIGRSYLSTLDLEDMLNVLRYGESFVGKSKRVNIPLYIRNKILYNNKYEFVYVGFDAVDVSNDWSWSFEKNKFVYTPKKGEYVRQVLREPSSFYFEHYREIFAQKHEFYEQLFKDMSNKDYWLNRKVEDKFAVCISTAMSHANPSRLADYYLSYYGVNERYWQYSDPAVQFLVRYLKFVPITHVEPWQVETSLLFDDYRQIIDYCCTQLHCCINLDLEKRKRSRLLKDYYSHRT